MNHFESPQLPDFTEKTSGKNFDVKKFLETNHIDTKNPEIQERVKKFETAIQSQKEINQQKILDFMAFYGFWSTYVKIEKKWKKEKTNSQIPEKIQANTQNNFSKPVKILQDTQKTTNIFSQENTIWDKQKSQVANNISNNIIPNTTNQQKTDIQTNEEKPQMQIIKEESTAKNVSESQPKLQPLSEKTDFEKEFEQKLKNIPPMSDTEIRNFIAKNGINIQKWTTAIPLITEFWGPSLLSKKNDTVSVKRHWNTEDIKISEISGILTYEGLTFLKSKSWEIMTFTDLESKKPKISFEQAFPEAKITTKSVKSFGYTPRIGWGGWFYSMENEQKKFIENGEIESSNWWNQSEMRNNNSRIVDETTGNLVKNWILYQSDNSGKIMTKTRFRKFWENENHQNLDEIVKSINQSAENDEKLYRYNEKERERREYEAEQNTPVQQSINAGMNDDIILNKSTTNPNDYYQNGLHVQKSWNSVTLSDNNWRSVSGSHGVVSMKWVTVSSN